MNSKDRAELSGEWAWTQVEAMADGSLRGGARKRMQQALRADAALRAAVARARSLRRELERAGRAPVPPALPLRLAAIAAGPTARPPMRMAARLVLPIAAAAVVAAIVVVRPGWRTPPVPPPDSRAAVQEFELALRYLRKSAAVTNEEVGRAVGYGLREALIASRDSVRREQQQ